MEDKAQKRAPRLAKNVFLSVFAQGLSVVVSVILGFIVPKFIPETDYADWQKFVLWLGYVGVLPLGLLDGIILRYAQYDYDGLEKPRMRTLFTALFGWLSLLATAGCVLSLTLAQGEDRVVFFLVSVGILTSNLYAYNCYLYQITNRINLYVLFTLMQRIVYGIVIVICLFAGIGNFYWYCIAELAGHVVVFLAGIYSNRACYFGKTLPLREALTEIRDTTSVGFLLMAANFSASLMVGGAKIAVEWRWDKLTFGQVAYSFSAVNLFVNFATTISIVLFPFLKRLREEELPGLYRVIRGAVSPFLFAAMLGYFPLRWLLSYWLPKYGEAIIYLGALLPLMVFSSKVSLLTNNYMKVYRKEGLMLYINLGSLAFGLALFALGAWVFSSIDFILISVVLAMMLRSVLCEAVVGRVIRQRMLPDFLAEFVMTAVFIASAKYLPLWYGCLAYAGALLLYVILYRKQLMELLARYRARNKSNGEAAHKN